MDGESNMSVYDAEMILFYCPNCELDEQRLVLGIDKRKEIAYDFRGVNASTHNF